MLTPRFLLVTSIAVVVAACGRSSPVAQPTLDEAGAEQAAKSAAFDTEDELTAVLDDNYLAADTPVLDEAQVAQIAKDNAFDTKDELKAQLDGEYLAVGTVVLSNVDVESFARNVCFDTEQELHDVLDDDYLPSSFVPPPVNFVDLVGIPSGLLDGDNDTAPTVTAPLLINGARNISLDTSGCQTGETYVFNGTNLNNCAPPAATQSLAAVGANGAAPREALPIIAKGEVSALAVTTTAAHVSIYAAGAAAPKHNMLIVDAWVIAGTAGAGAVWNLRKNVAGANTRVTSDEVVPTAVGDAIHVGNFANAAARTITTADTLDIEVSTAGANETDTFTVFVLAVPI